MEAYSEMSQSVIIPPFQLGFAAQMVEHRFRNTKLTGSIPSHGQVEFFVYLPGMAHFILVNHHVHIYNMQNHIDVNPNGYVEEP